MTAARFLNYGRHRVEQDDIDAVTAVLRGEYLTQGPAIARFEAELAERVGARHAVAVTSGTAALHIACLAAGLAAGRRGVTSALTFIASANAMLFCGAEAALADIELDGLGLRPELLARTDVDVVMPVLFAGLAHRATEIRRAAGKAVVIEDASHALGGAYEDGRAVGCGAHADMTVFSFHPVKPITTGEGGAVVTNDGELARLLRLYRSHGMERDPARFVAGGIEEGAPLPWHYEQQVLGFNYRMTDLQAALGVSQLRKLERYVARRRAIAARYDAAFRALPQVALPQSDPAQRARSAHHLYIALFDFAALGVTRRRFLERLRRHQVGAQVHYIPVYRQPYHAARGKATPPDFPATESYFARCLSLPMHPDLSDDEVERVIGAVREAVGA